MIKLTNTFKDYKNFKSIYLFPVLAIYKWESSEGDNNGVWTIAIGWILWVM